MSVNAFNLLCPSTSVSKKTAKKNVVPVPYKQKQDNDGDVITKKPPVFPAKRISKKDDIENNTRQIIDHSLWSKDAAAHGCKVNSLAMQLGYKTVEEKTGLSYFMCDSIIAMSAATINIIAQAKTILIAMGVCVRCLTKCVNLQDGKFTVYCKNCSSMFWTLDPETNERKRVWRIDGLKNASILNKRMKVDDGHVDEPKSSEQTEHDGILMELYTFNRDSSYGPYSNILPSVRLARTLALGTCIGKQFIDPDYFREKNSSKREEAKKNGLKDTQEWLMKLAEFVKNNPKYDVISVSG